MLKKLTLMGMAVGALLAFIAPTASATGPLIVDELGAGVPVGGKITATSTNMTTQTSLGTIECLTVIKTYTYTTNSNTTAHGHGSGTAKGTIPAKTHDSHCGTSTGTKISVTEVSVSTFHLTRHGSIGRITTGIQNFLYTYKIESIFGTFHCTMTGTNVPMERTGTSTINVAGSLVGTGSGLCPSSGTFNGDFSLVVTATGKPAHLL